MSRGAPNGRVACSLARVVGKTPANAAELHALRRRAWRETGVVVLRPEEIADDFARQAVMNAATTLFGPRPAYPATAERKGRDE